MSTQILKISYLLISFLVSLFVGAISIAGGHGQFNKFSLLAILIILSAIITAIFYNKEGKTKSFIYLLSLLTAAGSYLILIIDFFSKKVSDRFVEFHTMKWVIVLGFLLLLYLFIKKATSLFK